MGLRLPLTTHLADRVRAMLVDRAGWARFPDDVREWLEVQDWRSQMPGPDNLLVESFPHAKRHYTVYYTFTGWNANQSLGMLITKRMEERGLMPGGLRRQRLLARGVGPEAGRRIRRRCCRPTS